ncbi:2,3,4,5-tetrahydropyridine-2,6-dicarboxylate N-succinyltransferase [Ehrlichia ruminantium]|uniref:2,3,4,5-tetrahydropyridine-2,6-dicarboxylate N-succinyltransferase n=2 Tax=Ehrlichia ruminantium TaxID=779 RepID=DAPD_EHRRG|nr:2,3,4,5-tetrahydropyridine-2,6-dicarboxylate N-succinyltransferase [Ehrlichia ruminantium]Q5FF20.2 RecName: Full=2,3,4,5-tetrahydropyridine-2,6-dicarboxylate N-succinyltransferase; AltName: Full=Tetrahydrodipicolinate N-succinyltransferase; Short=THDP succinyltransferase; Short=THP succinyltransferase; Short=Tetrahydropicolinate succinylase [Ehrlichia ruminantium str. Gardel]KYW97555.1 2,3,4,5-tetrahydropyridine-2,6-dicarboxylate N-succinyltransferase [Ehrlichia ruminantium]QLK54709.1 2,3,4,5
MVNTSDFKEIIENAWCDIANISTNTSITGVIDEIMDLLDQGKVRVSEKINGQWIVNEWIKKAILLSFRIYDMKFVYTNCHDSIIGNFSWFDKIPLKFGQWNADNFKQAKIRVVPGAIVRKSAYIAPGAVLMPSFVNVGAYVGEGTMVDTWASVGSCAQVGKNCHISGGAGIGGVLEPLTASPVIIEDNCFIGARSEIVEGVIVEEGAVVSMGVYIGASTKIIDRTSGEVFFGRVPAYSVVVPGSYSSGNVSIYCAIIVKKVDQNTRNKVSINELLRDNYAATSI